MQQLSPDAAQALGQHIGAEQEHGPGFGFAERFSKAAGMAANQIGLKLDQTASGNAHVGEFTETGVDAVDSLTRFQNGFNDLAALLDSRDGQRSDGDKTES